MFYFCGYQELEERLEEEVDNNANVGAAKRKVEAALEHAEEQLENVKQQMQMVNQCKPSYHTYVHVCIVVGARESSKGEGQHLSGYRNRETQRCLFKVEQRAEGTGRETAGLMD